MNYVVSPKEVSIKEIEKHQFSFSPLQYRRIEIRNKNTKKIRELIEEQLISGSEVGSLAYVRVKSNYRFLRTKACQDNCFQLNLSIPGSYEYIKPDDFFQNKGKHDERILQENDLIFVTGGNVGEVAISQKLENAIVSSHIVKIPITECKYYVFAFLKNNFGKEQANLCSPGSIKGLDTFNNEILLDIKIPFPNQKNKRDVVEYIELLVKAVIKKENEIHKKDNFVVELIDNELIKNQKKKKFSYAYPSYNEILKTSNRLETGMYTQEFKKIDFLLNNYQNGWKTLSELGFTVSRGQNLQFSNIGQSIYSTIPKKGFYKLALSTHFSEYATITKYKFIGNKNNLKEIKNGDIIFSCRGVLFGRVCIFCEPAENTITNIDNVHITNDNAKLKDKISIGLFLNYMRKKGHLHRIAITGSGANSLTQYQFDLLKIPIFPDLKKEEIVNLFYNKKISKYAFNMDDFKKKDAVITEQSGIFQLDKQIKTIKEKINMLVNQIINNQEIEIDFDFYNQAFT